MGVAESPLSARDKALLGDVVARDRRSLAKAITLVESTRADHRARAQTFIDALLPHAGNALRIGITGVPGVGKSTFIEAFGLALIGKGHRVAVLAIDPSSSIGGGSILGDKTRMEKLSMHADAFVRPSPAAGSLGGVAARTREAMLVCEAAGFDIVIVETVGVGQSETAVAGMTDIFLLLQLPNAGDELQAMKKGVVELADVVAVNKADLDRAAAEGAVGQIARVLSMLRPRTTGWSPAVLAVSAATGMGLEELWERIAAFRDTMRKSGELAAKRRRQALDWMWQLIDEALRARFRAHPEVRAQIDGLVDAVARGRTSPTAAAARLVALAEQRKGQA
jgi:LAO/AO transport system kinase